jgi:hypothetical protein
MSAMPLGNHFVCAFEVFMPESQQTEYCTSSRLSRAHVLHKTRPSFMKPNKYQAKMVLRSFPVSDMMRYTVTKNASNSAEHHDQLESEELALVTPPT